MTTPMSDQSELQARADRVKVGHLVTGIVLLGIAVVWALHAGGAIDGIQTGVVIPALLVVAGVAGLAAMVVQGRRRRPTPTDTDTHPLEEQS